MTENYLALLEESLKRKLQVMAEIQDYNLRQQEIFQADKEDVDKFDGYVAEKGALIDKLNALDNGFEKLYARASEELKDNRHKYGEQIKNLQNLVAKVMETSVTIQAQEARNKRLIENYFQKEKEGIRMGRKTSKAAVDYYRNMNKSSVVMPLFMDSKK